MPKVDPQAILELTDVRRAMAAAAAKGPFEGALFAWLYEFGARAAEPGLLRMSDLDLYGKRARPRHQDKKGNVKPATGWHALLPGCERALPLWLEVRGDHLKTKEQADFVFPSRRPGRCYTCRGTGQRPILKNNRPSGNTTPCRHCDETGKRWGVARQEVHRIVTQILADANVPPGRRHPHVLRHSIITHLLEGDVPPTVVQDRVGHANLATTLEYARATRKAKDALTNALGDLYE